MGSGFGRLVVIAGIATALASSGCAHFVCPARGGPPWRELRTAHFSLLTDLSSSDAHDLARELELTHAVITRALPAAAADASDSIRVVAFAREREYQQFAPEHAGAYYTLSKFGEPTIVLPGSIGREQRAVLAHELTHHIQHRVFARLPGWAAEGLATYMETLGTGSGPHPQAELGGVPKWAHVVAVRSAWSMARVLGRDATIDSHEAYATSWALVHFLMNAPDERFNALLRRFGAGEDGRSAWLAVYPEWDPDQPGGVDELDRAVHLYLRSGRYRSHVVEPTAPGTPGTERPLASAAVHDITLMLERYLPGDEGRTAEVEEALSEDPTSVGAITALAIRRDPRALELARSAAAAHREDFRPWLLLDMLLPVGEPRAHELVLRRAAAAPGATYVAFQALARFYYDQGRAAEGLPLALEATARAPWSDGASDTAAVLLRALGRCAESAVFTRHALEVLRESAEPSFRAGLVERLRQLQTCREGARPPAPSGEKRSNIP